MRHEATQALFESRDVVIVSSVSCIYGLRFSCFICQIGGDTARKGSELDRDAFLRSLIEIQYSRNDANLVRGAFRVRGDVVDILPSSQNDEAIRVEFFGDEIEELSIIDVLTGKTKKVVESLSIYPNSHYVTEQKDMRVK